MVRSHEHPAAVWLPRWHASVAIAVIGAALLAAPAAHATVTDDVAAVTSEVESMTETVTKALPSTPVPIETPPVPKAVPSPSPPPAAKPPPAASATDAAATAPNDLGGGAGEVARAPSGAEGTGASAGLGAGGEPESPPVARGPDRRSIAPAEAAPLPHWRTYVWPAIALRVGDALQPLLAPMEGLARIDVPDVFGLLSPDAVPASAEPDPGGVDSPAARADQPSQPPWSSIALPKGGMGLLVALVVGLLVVACFVSLARLVVGEELFESRYWRGHRG